MSSGLTCVAIVAYLDEAAFLGRFLASMDAQTRRPERLVLVDDGSTDGSLELCRAFAADRPWVEVLARPARPPSKDRLRGAPEWSAFLWAVGERGGDEDALVKMDADLELAPHHFATVLEAMEAEPRLGIAGTYLTARRPDGSEYQEDHSAQHVRGPTRFFRRSCWEEISPIPPLLGWDGADEVRARARGWSTRSLPIADPPSYHLRPTGSQNGRLRAFARWGECAYAIGAHPVGVLASAAYRLRDRPRVIGSAAYVVGWARAGVRRTPRFPDDILRASRDEQLARLRRLRRNAPSA